MTTVTDSYDVYKYRLIGPIRSVIKQILHKPQNTNLK
jgi:hypothetical protein